MSGQAPKAVDLLITGGAVVCIDAAATMHADGAIAIRNRRIAWIGAASEARARFTAATTIDARGTIAMPGLIDGHFHTAQQLLRGKIVALGRTRTLKNPVW